MSEDRKLVGTSELARILGVSHTAVGKAVDSGRIKITKMSDSGRPQFDSETCMVDWAANSQAIMQRGEAGKGGRPRSDGTKAQPRPKPDNLAAGSKDSAAKVSGEKDRINANPGVSVGLESQPNGGALKRSHKLVDESSNIDDDSLIDENGIPNLNRSTATEKYYKALRAKLDYEEAAGKLVAIDLVAKIVEKEYIRVRSRFLAISSKLAPELALTEDVAICRKIIDDAINDCLAELSADENPELLAVA